MLTNGAWLREYMDNLQREADEMRAAWAAALAERQKPLHAKIAEWYARLPPPHRKSHYTMDELVQQLNKAPRLIGEALHRLGWQRKRKWTGGGPYVRYWVPPE